VVSAGGFMPVKNLRQSVTIRASPHDVYTTLVDPKEHAKFSGAAARISLDALAELGVFVRGVAGGFGRGTSARAKAGAH
jgi:uncharacterized protein YndB with AHSA1/START domain